MVCLQRPLVRYLSENWIFGRIHIYYPVLYDALTHVYFPDQITLGFLVELGCQRGANNKRWLLVSLVLGWMNCWNEMRRLPVVFLFPGMKVTCKYSFEFVVVPSLPGILVKHP